MSYKEKTYFEKNGEKIYGEKLPVIYYNRGEYYLYHIMVFKGGIISGGELKDLDQIKNEIKTGRILQNIPNNIELECELGIIESSKFTPEKNEDDLIKEIEDIINELNDRDTRRAICENSFKIYLIEPSESNLGDLINKYNDLPSHQKVLFEYIEEKDPLCCLINEGEIYTFDNRKDLLKHYFKINL